MHDDDMPIDPEDIFATVEIRLNRDDVHLHTHEDGTAHELATCTLTIENHGFPNEKFVEALLLSAQSVVSVFFREEVIKDSVPQNMAEKMSGMLARQFIAEKVSEGDYPESVALFMIPTSMPVTED